MSLKPLQCDQCAGPVPLGDGSSTECPWCGSQMAVPSQYGQALELRARADEARQQAEPLWRRLGVRPPRWAIWLAAGLVVLLPPLVTLIGNLVAPVGRSVAATTALFTLPAVLPGAGLWIWVAAVGATVRRFQEALTADPPPEGKQGPPCCRSCGAPLSLVTDAVSATCDYCGTDSLVQDVPTRKLKHRLKESLKGLGEAVHALRLRRLRITFGTLGVLLGIGLSSALLFVAILL